MATIFEKLENIEARYDELTAQLSSPDVLGDSTRYQKLARTHADLSQVVAKYREWKQIENGLRETKQMLVDSEDAEIMQLAHEEDRQLTERKETVERELKRLLLPRDPMDDKNVLLEIRAGTGGDEAALFAAELFRMYGRYAERMRWKVEIVDRDDTGIGGIKTIAALIEGEGAFSKLKYESGVHRVQRVPATESSGRIHTSAATVAVLPEAEEVDIAIADGDLKIDTMRAAGAGGQHVNKTESAIRVTHIPSG